MNIIAFFFFFYVNTNFFPIIILDTALPIYGPHLAGRKLTKTPVRRKEKVARKIIASPENWAKNIAKSNRDKGLAYVSQTSKKEMPPKKLGAPCTCKEKCFEKVTMPKIQEIFDNYWKAGSDYSMKTQILMDAIQPRTVKRRRQRDPTKSDRPQWFYWIQHGKQYQVCRNAFRSIYGISESRLKSVISLKGKNPTGSPVVDQRGRQPSGNQIAGDRIDLVHKHIKMLYVTQSHHARSHSPHRMYMDPSLNTRLLYIRYVDWLVDHHDGQRAVKESKYRDIFNNHYNIVPHPPRSDTCEFCTWSDVQMKSKSSQNIEVSVLKDDLKIHVAEARKQQKLLSHFEQSCIEDGPYHEWRTICIDLQQTLPVPRLNNQSSYYKSKVCLYNCCIFDLNHNQANCYLWDETMALKGSNEVNSCLLKWFKNFRSENFTRLRIFADNCAGQNKNIFMVLNCLRLLQKCK